MTFYKSSAWLLRYATPKTKLIVTGITILLIDAVLLTIYFMISECLGNEIIKQLSEKLFYAVVFIGIFGCSLFLLAFLVGALYPISAKIRCMVCKGLFAYQYGNPLNLKDGEILPNVRCKEVEKGKYCLYISATNATVEDIQKLSSNISSSLNRTYQQYAVTITNADVAFNGVRFIIEDVTVHKELTFTKVEQMKPAISTKLVVQEDTCIDLTTSGSILCAGKTRSGKTTGIISLILQVLLCKRDKYGSQVTIIDPKQAELSQLPYVVTVDEDGEARQILDTIKKFTDDITERQKILNELSRKKGDAVHWFDNEANFHVSLLFIDEYVSCRSLFPKKADKNSDYCLATFDSLIKRVVTMGASAGCYVIISIAEASVEEGGLPSMLKSAMSTKILFRPTLQEGRLMWDSEKLKNFPERVYNAGDAWFSSTDGIHDDVTYVHFPIMNFPVYRELGQLLRDYYEENNTACDSEA